MQSTDTTTALRPIDDGARSGDFIIIFGPSGYCRTPLRAAVARWDATRSAWITHSGDRFTDDGADATAWIPLPSTKREPP